MPVSDGPHMFTKVKIDPEREADLQRRGWDTKDPLVLLKEIDTNTDMWDSLTTEVVKMMVNPPTEYNAAYQKSVNIAILSALAALQRSVR